MDTSRLLDLWSGALTTLALTATPFLLAALAVGLLASLIQAATQLQENIISFAPKLVATGLVLSLAGPWILDRLVRFTATAMATMTTIGREVGR